MPARPSWRSKADERTRRSPTHRGRPRRRTRVRQAGRDSKRRTLRESRVGRAKSAARGKARGAQGRPNAANRPRCPETRRTLESTGKQAKGTRRSKIASCRRTLQLNEASGAALREAKGLVVGLDDARLDELADFGRQRRSGDIEIVRELLTCIGNSESLRSRLALREPQERHQLLRRRRLREAVELALELDATLRDQNGIIKADRFRAENMMTNGVGNSYWATYGTHDDPPIIIKI